LCTTTIPKWPQFYHGTGALCNPPLEWRKEVWPEVRVFGLDPGKIYLQILGLVFHHFQNGMPMTGIYYKDFITY